MADDLFSYYLQLLDEVRSALLFPLLPKWAIIEAKVTIGILGFSICCWIVMLYLRWRKGALWTYRWEGDGYFRPNIYLFIPISATIFSILYLVYVVGTINRNVPNAERDWIPYFSLYQAVFTVPLFFIGALWTWNSILSASHARKTMPIQHGQKIGEIRLLPFVLNPWIIQSVIVITAFTLCLCITIFGILSSIHREKAISEFQKLNSILRDAISGQAIDLGLVANIQSDLQLESGKALVNYRRLTTTQATTLLLYSGPYLYSVIRLFYILHAQRIHLNRALLRLYQIEVLDQKDSVPGPEQFSGSSLSWAKVSDPLSSSDTTCDLRVDNKNQPFDNNKDAVQVKQQKETVKRMKKWRGGYRTIMIAHILGLVVFAGFNMVNITNAIDVSGGSLNKNFSTFISTHIPVYCFAVPQLVGSVYLLYEAIGLPSSPKGRVPQITTIDLHEQPRTISDDVDELESVVRIGWPDRISTANPLLPRTLDERMANFQQFRPSGDDPAARLTDKITLGNQP